jgi:protein-L-isoaspartate(D-aspartate) O-methyltransferase
MPTKARGGQILVRITRTEDGYHQENLEAVNFVPLLGGLV